ncbi:hypothetical protein K431DRAFT_238953 [Polychaeton citri CBS 116435]|uniref:non-specific serine/threonine protein kinase n=1 Tax=Polychaeton citri CBS 116435 TaxID=1314669 RepID=A0A9P4UV00_9PEZI|nr:hypothetical protein K431DRAFT_238953 [Polychaeton citri CBS 116435]
MSSGRPPGLSKPSLKAILLWSTVLLPALTAALQQQPDVRTKHRYSVGEQQQQNAPQAQPYDSLYTPDADPRGFRDTYVGVNDEQLDQYGKKKKKKRNDNVRTPSDERALATFPTADSAAARVPPAPNRSPASSAGIDPSRQSARSLQEFEVEDIILLATVDGKIHAHDRISGDPRWQLEHDKPMVETSYHRHNKSVDDSGVEQPDPLWIVEPSQDGSIYVYAPGSGIGMQRLGYTVKQLAELAPYASEGTPSVVYTARKSNTLYTVDAATGNILKMFSSDGSISNNDQSSCRRVNPLESLDEAECDPMGTLMLSHTEYTIGIQDRNTGEAISTLKYFEWGPNNHDQDLRSQNARTTLDNKYVYSKFDGTVYSLDLAKNKDYLALERKEPLFMRKLTSPVARVFDVIRPFGESSTDASLIILPQPTGPSEDEWLDDFEEEDVFVNCTEAGSWYALSESKYPTVTKGARSTRWYSDDTYLPHMPMSSWQRERFMGIHRLSNGGERRPSSVPMIDPPREALPPSNVDEREDDSNQISKPILPIHQQPTSGATLAIPTTQVKHTPQPSPLKKTVKLPDAVEVLPSPPLTPMIREHEPAQETIFPNRTPERKRTDSVGAYVDVAVGDDGNELEPVTTRERKDSIAAEGDTPRPKKKATRGKRGGQKNRDKEVQKKVNWEAKNTQQPPAVAPVETISVAASESTQISGSLRINSLVINTDEVIGQGSCGTSVFRGTFEGRDVAVKRMLSQYYELASQEVSFLQQSDDHANVIRYFCQQRDDHFLYIAVELCQASLFEVWDTDKIRSEARQRQLQDLKLSIQQDVPRTLHQLAAGLYHLHNLRIIHRDIKPQNILVAFPKKNQNNNYPRLVISDFGLGKNLPENVSTLIDPTGNAGTSGWKAPELISQPKETRSEHSQQHSHTASENTPTNGNGTSSGVKRAADIFSLGCLFFWVLTNGIHPYEDDNGWTQLRELNIKRDNKKMDVLSQWSDAYEPMQLITSMLEHQPENRPSALQVLNHPFFWPAEKRLAFLCDCSDHFEREPRGIWNEEPPWASDSYHLKVLESRAEEIIGPNFDFLAKLDRHFVDTLGRQRKYNGDRVLDLLRALRNKKNHYEDMSEDVKKRVGPLPGGYLSFWCHRFPRLLMACFEVIHECGVEKNDRFKGYFVSAQS